MIIELNHEDGDFYYKIKIHQEGISCTLKIEKFLKGGIFISTSIEDCDSREDCNNKLKRFINNLS